MNVVLLQLQLHETLRGLIFCDQSIVDPILFIGYLYQRYKLIIIINDFRALFWFSLTAPFVDGRCRKSLFLKKKTFLVLQSVL